jgi:symplekin
MSAPLSIEEQIAQLNQAKALAVQDASFYPQIVLGLLPLVKSPDVTLKRWCSSFFIDAFTSFSLEKDKKKLLAIECVDEVLTLLNDTDYVIQKNAITIAANVYGFAMMAVAENDSLVDKWNTLTKIKATVLRLWESEHFGVEAESIKFAQQVIIVQSFVNRDPRLADNGSSNEFSLSSVRSDHPLIHPSLEAESQGLLDRILSVFQDSKVNAKIITATFYAVSALMKVRPGTISKCLKAILSFDITQKSVHGQTAKEQEVEFKIIKKALKIFLQHVLKSSMAPKYNSQIEAYLSSLSRASDSSLKRQPESQLNREDVKRIKTAPNPMPVDTSTDVPPGPYSYASLYSLLDKTDPLLQFDTETLPLDMALNITLAGIASVNPQLLQNSINIVKARYDNFLNTSATKNISAALSEAQLLSTSYNPSSSGDTNPEYSSSNITSSVARTTAPTNPAAVEDEYPSEEEFDHDLSTGSFMLPPPSKLNDSDKIKAVKEVVERMFANDKATTDLTALPAGSINAKKGIDRVAITEWSRDTWVTLVCRLVSQGLADPVLDNEETEKNDSSTSDSFNLVETMRSNIREKLFAYVMANFRERLDIIIEWLNEEWFGEFVQNKSKFVNTKSEKVVENTDHFPSKESVYFQYTTRLLADISPFLTKADRPQFLRLLSDLPELNGEIVHNLKRLCLDPLRSELGMGSLL